MQKKLQAMRSAGEIERYNSLRQKEKNEDDRIESHLIDLNVAKGNGGGGGQVVKNQQVKITKTTVTSMIDKKKVFLDGYIGGKHTSIISQKNIEIEKTSIITTTTSSTRPAN